MRANPTGPQALELDLLTKYNYYTMGVCGAMGLWAFWVQMKTGKVRKETFGRNFEIIEEKFGEMHTKELGPDTKLSKYGYPDMGNNIYSDLLPYKDWIRINNAQRCHENMVN